MTTVKSNSQVHVSPAPGTQGGRKFTAEVAKALIDAGVSAQEASPTGTAAKVWAHVTARKDLANLEPAVFASWYDGSPESFKANYERAVTHHQSEVRHAQAGTNSDWSNWE